MQTQNPIENPQVETTHVYVNCYQVPGSPTITVSVHPSRQQADAFGDDVIARKEENKKRRIARMRLPVMCIAGQFDL